MRPLSRHVPRPLAAVPLALAALAALAATPARATVTVTVNGSSDTFQFGLALCEDGTSETFSYDYSASSYASSSPTVILRRTPNADCSADSTADYTYPVESSSATSGSVAVKLSDFLFGASCDESDASDSAPGVAYFCVLLENSAATVVDSGHVTINYATVPPDPPIGIVVEPGDQQLHISWTNGDSAATISEYQVYVEPDSTDGGPAITDLTQYSAQVAVTSATVGSTSVEKAALVNGAKYTVAVSAIDSYGNTSSLSALVPGQIPEAVDDFYDYYVAEGGSARGGHGCASGGGVAWGALALLGLWMIVRRRKARSAARAAGIAALVLVGLPPAARADDSMNQVSAYAERADRRFFFALEADKYTPQIDSEKDLDGHTPYRDIFGSRVPWRIQGEFAWEFLPTRNFGTFMIGASFGFWQNIGKGIFATGANAGTPSSDTTLLDVWPIGLEATWRYDSLAERVRWLPIIPYAKVGLMEALWVIYSGNGAVAHTSNPSGRGSGWTPGYTTALGVAISLDAIDPSISNEAYIELGLQRTSIFAEYGWTRLDGFRSAGELILSDRGPRFGLSLEF